jgi:hypothetical protein
MIADPDLAKVRALCSRLEQPFWMPDPDKWVWLQPDGRPQGPGLVSYASPGLTNLLWLALDLPAPPPVFQMTDNLLAGLVLLLAGSSRLVGQPLLDMAALHPLDEFAALLPEARAPGSNSLEGAYPVLRLLALRRLRHG